MSECVIPTPEKYMDAKTDTTNSAETSEQTASNVIPYTRYATERLRALEGMTGVERLYTLLEDHGVECEHFNGEPTWFGSDGRMHWARQEDTHITVFHLTPEQAMVATLGPDGEHDSYAIRYDNILHLSGTDDVEHFIERAKELRAEGHQNVRVIEYVMVEREVWA